MVKLFLQILNVTKNVVAKLLWYKPEFLRRLENS